MLLNILKFLPLIERIFSKIQEIFYHDSILPSGSRIKNRIFMTANTTIELSSRSKTEVEKNNEFAKRILKKHLNEPEKILEFIEAKGTIVLKLNHIDKILAFLGKSEGFLAPTKGFKALFLSLFINILSKDKKIRIGFKTPEMFIMRNLPLNLYFFSHQFHLWLAYKKKLPGCDDKTIEKFKNIWNMPAENARLSKLSLNEILSLKDAITRDIEAIDFVKSFVLENVSSQRVVNNIKNGQSASI